MKTINNEAYSIYVGENAHENDALTFGSIAKPRDLWFHVKDYPGAHVILISGVDEAFTDTAIKTAAALAKHHSKAKTLTSVRVEYCHLIDVTKPSRYAPAGLVTIKNSKTILV